MSVQKLVDDFLKEKFPESFPAEESIPQAQEKVLDIYEFDDLIESYKEAQMGGSFLARMNTRRALKEAYRAALRAVGRSDR
jgi:hypothetical protein